MRNGVCGSGTSYVPVTPCCNGTTHIIINTTSIDNNAFFGCTALQAVTMPLVTTIGDFAFADSTALQSISMPLVASIGYSVFYACISLQSLTMPLVTTIGDFAFYICVIHTSGDNNRQRSLPRLYCSHHSHDSRISCDTGYKHL